MRIRNRSFAVAVAAAVLGLGGSAVVPAAAAGPQPGNLGHFTEDKMYPGQYLRNGAYTFYMQADGNLVLYHDSIHRVCWASNTQHLLGTYVDYNDHSIDPPDVTLKNATYGNLGHWWGGYEWLHKNGNLSLNSKGEVWIAWKKWVHC